MVYTTELNNLTSPRPTSLPLVRHTTVTIALIKAVVFAIFSMIIVLGNMLVCAAVIKFRRLQRVTNYFIVSLAVADMLVGLVVMPFSAAYEVLGWWPFGRFCDVHSSFDVTLCCASLYNLCIVSIDRYIAITKPLTYQSKMTPKVAFILIGVVWVLAFSTFIPMVMGLSHEKGFEMEYQDPETCKFVINKLFTFLITVPPFYIPCVFMFIAYTRMFTIAHKQAKLITNHTLRTNGHCSTLTLREKSRLAYDTKALRVVITVVGVFIICWLPYFIVFPYDTFCRCVSDQVWGVTLWLGYLNSSFNPLIYAFNRDFRAAFLAILRRKSLQSYMPDSDLYGASQVHTKADLRLSTRERHDDCDVMVNCDVTRDCDVISNTNGRNSMKTDVL